MDNDISGQLAIVLSENMDLHRKIDKHVEKIAELEKDIAYYRCCSLSGEVACDLCKPSSIALQAKALKESK